MPDADLVVEVQTEVVPPSVDEAKKEAELPKIEPIEDLRAQFDALKSTQEADKAAAQAARDEAARERQARERAEADVAKVRTDLTESNVSAVDSALAAAKAEADNFQREQQTAFEAGDFKAASDAGRKMARAEATISRLEEGKANLIERKTEQPKREDRQAVQQQETRSQAWLRTHPNYNIPGSSENFEAIAAHNKAMAKRIAVDSDAYFDFVETELGLKASPKPNGAERQPENRTRAMPGAPVSRDDTPTGGQPSPTRVTLTRGEVEAAEHTLTWNYTDPKIGAVKGQPIGTKEYARRKIAMQKEGRYGVLSDS